MSKGQLWAIGVSIGLLLLLYFGFDTKPKSQKALEKSRALVAESADVNVLIKDAKTAISALERADIESLESRLADSVLDSVKIEFNKQLSGAWYRLGQYAIAGHYAQQVAEQENTDQAWSIAGTTFTIGLQRSESEKEKKFSKERAIRAFENAISLNPDNPANQVNLALVYTEQPDENNPMKGIQMLLKLNQEQPENVLVLSTLARLAIRTGQYDRAKERLEKALSIEPNNVDAVCMLALVLSELGEETVAEATKQRCETLNQ